MKKKKKGLRIAGIAVLCLLLLLGLGPNAVILLRTRSRIVAPVAPKSGGWDCMCRDRWPRGAHRSPR